MPLFIGIAGDLGVDVLDVEERLQDVLRQANDWGAVTPLDKADVFLEQRNNRDVNRNRLISVFLRTLEYFQPIPFLTTNQMNDLNCAFESRIDIHLDLPDMDRASRLRISKSVMSNLHQPAQLTERDYQDWLCQRQRTPY
ncbi:hypothetical protein PG984_005171 [Apiospora sp. TS-2023a]